MISHRWMMMNIFSLQRTGIQGGALSVIQCNFWEGNQGFSLANLSLDITSINLNKRSGFIGLRW